MHHSPTAVHSPRRQSCAVDLEKCGRRKKLVKPRRSFPLIESNCAIVKGPAAYLSRVLSQPRYYLVSQKKTDRRLLPRRMLINPPVLVSLSRSRTDLLFDLGEGGMSVYGLVSAPKGEVVPIAFALPGESGSVEAAAKIAWTSSSRNRTGLQFIDVTDNSREQLRKWMARAYTGPRMSRPTDKTTVPVAPAQVSAIASVKNEGDVQQTAALSVLSYGQRLLEPNPHRSTKPDRARVAVGILAGVVLLAVFGVARWYLPRRAEPRKANQIRSPGVEQSQPNSTEGPGGPSAEDSSLRSASSPPGVGFLLQLAAMAHQENADRLAESLKGRNHPAFVLRQKTDRLYRVVMGPYPDLSTAKKAKDALQGENIDAIVTPWTPD